MGDSRRICGLWRIFVRCRTAREALEETGLSIELLGQFHIYSDPPRDTRQHNISTVFIAKADGIPKAGSDANLAQVFITLPQPLFFDHVKILEDYFQWLKNGRSERIKIKPIRY